MAESETTDKTHPQFGAQAGIDLQKEMLEIQRAALKRRGGRRFREALDWANGLRHGPQQGPRKERPGQRQP